MSDQDGPAELYRELAEIQDRWSAALALLAVTAGSGAEALQGADPRQPDQLYAVARRIKHAVARVADAHTGYHHAYRQWVAAEETRGRSTF